jgi:hypothetical protein
MIFKNTAGQGLYLFATDASGNPKTGDAGNITATISKDGGAAASTATTHPTEIGGGIYWLTLAQAETNANALAVTATSTTSGVTLDPVIAYTTAGAITQAGAVGSVAGNIGGNVAGSVASVTAPVTVGTNSDKAGYSLNLAQTGLSPRNLGSIADGSLTVGDALVSAICAAAGKQNVSGTTYTVETPSTGTIIRAFTLDSGTSPTART